MFCYLVLVLFGLGWCDCYESLLFALRFFVLVVLGMVGFWLVCFWGFDCGCDFGGYCCGG